MPFFGSSTTTSSSTRRRGLFNRKPNRTTRIKNALDPNVNTSSTTRTSRSSNRVPLMTRVKRTLGIQSKSKRRGTFSRFQPRNKRTTRHGL